jgi:hypothetical protein
MMSDFGTRLRLSRRFNGFGKFIFVLHLSLTHGTEEYSHAPMMRKLRFNNIVVNMINKIASTLTRDP